MITRAPLLQIHDRLLAHFGPQRWWPANSPFEVAVGAVLTQNTAWLNVERALSNLKAAGALNPAAIQRLPGPELEELIRPAGFFRQKAATLKRLCDHLHTELQDRVEQLNADSWLRARQRLLAIKGIGPETADSILLYAAQAPTFVIDAYTHRLFQRLGHFNGTESYAVAQSFFMQSLPADPHLFNEYHALIVIQCKTFCRKRSPACPVCPLHSQCLWGLSENGK